MRSWSSWISFSKAGSASGFSSRSFREISELGGEVTELVVTADQVDGPVAGHPHKPGGGVVGQTVDRPRLKSLAKGVLDDVLGEVEAVQPEKLGQIRDHLSRLPAKKMVYQFRYVLHNGLRKDHIGTIGLISTDPSLSKIGEPWDNSTAWARSSASTTI